MISTTYLLLALLIALGAVIFALQNAEVIPVKFLGFEFEGSLAFILLVTFLLGVIVSLMTTLPAIIKKGRELRKLQNSTKYSKEEKEMSLTDNNVEHSETHDAELNNVNKLDENK